MSDSQEKVFLHYTGPIVYDTIGEQIGKFREAMFNAKIKLSVYKKVLMVMIESLENVFKYYEHFEKEKEVLKSFSPSITIKSIPNFFIVECSNPIRIIDIPKLKSRLDFINSLDRKGVKEEYKQIITNGEFSDKGGAGLGIIEMAKISDEKIEYSFDNINREFNQFHLKLRIKHKIN